MGFLDLLTNHERLRGLDRALRQSFGRLKDETSIIFSWLHYLREKDRVHDDRYYFAQQQLEKYDSKMSKLQDEIHAIKSEILTLKMDQGQVRCSYSQEI